VYAVKGNVDPPELDLPETLEFDLGGARIAMIHDSGRKEGRRKRLKRRFPKARVIIFGHSHIPFLEDEEGILLLNPGSPTDRRRQPHHTFALLHAEGGDVQVKIVAL
jgi:putative phosphoesterase